jgi:thymidylate synthase
MAWIDSLYSDSIWDILKNGYRYPDPNREGVNRFEIPSYTFRYKFEDEELPIITLRKIFYKGAINELICFLNGFTDVREYWKRGVNFWDKDVANFNNTSVEELRANPEAKTDMGAIYPFQWRNPESDQIAKLIYTMVNNPMSTSLIVNSWDHKQLKNMCLPPCHYSFQIICFPSEEYGYEFELHWSQRSTDLYLGFPTNIIFYTVLCKLLELFTGYKAKAVVGDLKNVHLYDNQYCAATEISLRNPFTHKAATLEIQEELKNMLEKSNAIIKAMDYNSFVTFLNVVLGLLTDEMFQVNNYESHPALKVEMLAHTIDK